MKEMRPKQQDQRYQQKQVETGRPAALRRNAPLQEAFPQGG